MNEFLEEYERMLERYLSFGLKRVPIDPFGDEQIDIDKRKKFISACHIGYQKAQDRVISLLQQNADDKSLDAEEKLYRELLLRKIIDTLAFIFLGGQIHIIRRLSIHDRVIPVDLKIIKYNQEIANGFNMKSHLTFSLLADLTTFIQLFDILKVDFRPGYKRLSFIELKTGKVNEILLNELEKYELKEESIKKIKTDKKIKTEYKKQATRILRQKIRLERLNEIIKTDKGIDPKLKKQISLIGNNIEEETYDAILMELIDSAKSDKDGMSSGMVNFCLHFGVGYSSDKNIAKESAISGAKYSLWKVLQEPPKGLTEIRNELLNKISEEDLYVFCNLFKTNIYSLPVKPFLLWGITHEDKFNLMKDTLSIFVLFDLSAFFWLGKKFGIDMHLSSRREADLAKKEFGAGNVLTFGNRIVKCSVDNKTFSMLSLIYRFFTDLLCPTQFLYLTSKGLLYK